jgi:hypothetical protein
MRSKIMPRVTLVRYKTKPERADENEALSKAVFAELRQTNPDLVAYGLFRDGSDFVHLFANLAADDASAVTELASFKAFTWDINARCEAPPETTRLAFNLVESYGLPTARA